MPEQICPFSATLARDAFGCRHAESVIRRGGTEFACIDANAHARCRQLFGLLKNVALTAFDVEDDLNQMPHSVLVKTQFGGLLGLARVTPGQVADPVRIDDIDALLAAALSHFGALKDIPVEQFAADMTGYALARRRR
ncbi:MAG: hypothetical protein R3F42_11075 [Pseudomonadota bacterium]